MKTAIRYFLFLSVIIFASCRTSTTISVLRPAQIEIPKHIKKVGTVDRSVPHSKFLNVVEGLFSGEGIGQDKSGRRNAIDALANILETTPRFEVEWTGLELEGSKTGARMAPPISWDVIDDMCKKNDVDAIICIEKYDTDNYTNVDDKSREVKDSEGNVKIEKYFEANRSVRISIGWRFYDPKNRIIIDEWEGIEEINDSNSGETSESALGGLFNIFQAVDDVSIIAGENYGYRIAPLWVNIQRSIYNKGHKSDKDLMKKAKNYVDLNKWDNAVDVWSSLIDSSDHDKTKGRVSFNIAVAKERNDKLVDALKWAEISYYEYGLSEGKDYSNQLRERLNDRQRLNHQLSEE